MTKEKRASDKGKSEESFGCIIERIECRSTGRYKLVLSQVYKLGVIPRALFRLAKFMSGKERKPEIPAYNAVCTVEAEREALGVLLQPWRKDRDNTSPNAKISLAFLSKRRQGHGDSEPEVRI